MGQATRTKARTAARGAVYLLFFSLAIFASASAMAQGNARKITESGSRLQPIEPAPTAASEGETAEVVRYNAGTVGIVGGLREGAALRFVTDLASVVDDGDNMRVVPIVSRGMKQNILDLLYLRGVDIVITPSDSFEELKRERKTKNIERRVHYIAPLYVATTHIIVRPEIKTPEDLEGKKISFQGRTASTVTTGRVIFERLGIKVEPTYDDYGASMDKMKKGELFGVVLHRTKGDPSIASVDPKLGFRLLSVPYDKFGDYYVPVTFDNSTYPNLIGKDEKVEAIGSPTILAVYNWAPGTDRHRKVSRFIQYFFERFDTLTKPPYQPEWKEINLGARVPGWTRYFVVEEMLSKMKNANSPADTQLTADTKRSLNEADVKEFLEWKKQRNRP